MSIFIGLIILFALLTMMVATGVAISNPRFRIVAIVIAFTSLAIALATVGFFVLIVSRMG